MKEIKMSTMEFVRQYKKDPYSFLASNVKKFGEAYYIYLPFGRAHIITSPTFVEHILFSNYENYKKPFSEMICDTIGNQGLFTTNDKVEWYEDRTILNPLFSEESVKKHIDIVINITNERLEKWEEAVKNQNDINIHYEITNIAIHVLLKSFLGNIQVNFDGLSNLISEVMYLSCFSSRILSLFAPKFTRRYRNAKNEALRLGDCLVEQCLTQGTDNNNIIKLLAKKFKSPLTEKERAYLRSQLLTFLTVGHETTASLVIRMLVFLSLYPSHWHKIVEEVNNVLGNNKINSTNLSHFRYLSAILHETLRLQPPFNALARQALQDDTIGKYKILRGDYIMIDIYNLHRLSTYWHNPEGFDPSRFFNPLPENYKFLYIPFGAGPHKCIGQHFSNLEVTIIIIMIAQRYQLSLTSSSTLNNEITFLNRLNRQITMSISKIK